MSVRLLGYFSPSARVCALLYVSCTCHATSPSTLALEYSHRREYIPLEIFLAVLSPAESLKEKGS